MFPRWLQNVATGRAVVIGLVFWLGYAVFLFTLGPYSAVQTAGGGELLEESRYLKTLAPAPTDHVESDGSHQHRTFD